MSLTTLLLALTVLQAPDRPGWYQLTFPIPDVGEMRYALFLPRGYSPRQDRPLVLALHPGGQRFPYYGGAFAQQVVAPGLAELDAIIVAPDCPTDRWTDPNAERGVMALLRIILNQFSIDRKRMLVTGFSLGGRGTWFMSSRHADLFNAAIVMAGSPGDEPIDRLATIPTYVIHSRDDETVPFEPTELAVAKLKSLGKAIEFDAIEGAGHFQMGAYVAPLQRGAQWVSERWKAR
jgi:predicted peptidase